MKFTVTRRAPEVYREVDWIRGFEGLVAVSNRGNVVKLKDGNVLVLTPKRAGYIDMMLRKNSKHKSVKVHRLVAHAFVHNPDPTTRVEIDHIDNVTSNNDTLNLRWVTHQENMRNASKRQGTSSQFIGVCWKPNNNKWVAYAQVDGRHHYIGIYDDEEDAARARDVCVRKSGGSCWKYNFP